MKPEEAVAQWRALLANMKKADAKTLELIAHPEATDEQILEVSRERRATWAQFKHTTETLIEHCYTQGKPMLAGSVEREAKVTP